MPLSTLSLSPSNFLTTSFLSQTCNKFPVGAWYSARCFRNTRVKDPAHKACMTVDPKSKGNYNAQEEHCDNQVLPTKFSEHRRTLWK